MILIASLIVAGFLASTTVSASPTPADKNESELIREALIASGMEPGSDKLEAHFMAVRYAIDDLVWRVGTGKPTYRRAYKLHRVLHRRYFKHYDITVDDVSRIAEDGTFNCLSAVLFFGLVAERLGFETNIIEYPGHLLLELDVRGGRVLIETTSPVGYDIEPSRLLSYGRASSFGRAWLVMPPESAWSVPLDAAVGFTWLNRAWRTFENGEITRAVRFVEHAANHVPEMPQRVDAATRLLARAFAREYETGRFESAYRIARLEETLHPGRVTTQDRLLAVAQKRIEQLCAQDRTHEAAAIREELDRFEFENVALALFERTVTPTIVSAAVRAEEWALAETFVERYAASETDAVEIDRLRAWVESRRSNSDVECAEPPRSFTVGRNTPTKG
ncbi:MAG: hypothetical protein GTO30_05255 [Acidobacteria bacterium]|nr:hypothetical protein [Acidobacteriota bacterium]NIQ85600.1 hypothetical protein [Acidobacteriota bacterium]